VRHTAPNRASNPGRGASPTMPRTCSTANAVPVMSVATTIHEKRPALLRGARGANEPVQDLTSEVSGRIGAA